MIMNMKYRNERNARFVAATYSKSLDNPEWYKVENVSDDEANILLFDYIGWPFNDERDFIQSLEGMKQSKIIIRINSPGGDVFSANAIFNAIKAHPSKPITRIESIAASAASYIAMAGSQKQAYKNTMLMIHEPMTGMCGNQYEHREVADILEQISGQMIDMYADNTNVGKREIKDMLKAETWMTAKVAKEKGFVDTIIEAGKGAKAIFDPSIFTNCPECLRGDEAKSTMTEKELEKAIRDVYDLSHKEAKTVLALCRKGKGNIDDEAAQAGIKELIATMEKNISILKQ